MKKLCIWILALCLMLGLCACVEPDPTTIPQTSSTGDPLPTDPTDPTEPTDPTDPIDPLPTTKTLYVILEQSIENIFTGGNTYVSTTRYVRDENGFLQQVINLSNDEEHSRMDATCDESGLVVELEPAGEDSFSGVRIVMTYDASGKSLTTTQYRGELRAFHAEYTYDENGNIASLTETSNNGMQEHVQVTQYVYENGLLVGMDTCENDVLVSRVTYALGTDGLPERMDVYDGSDLLMNYTLYSYDGLTTTATQYQSDGTLIQTTTATADDHGHVISQEEVYADGTRYITTNTYLAVEVPLDAPDREM